MALSQIYLVVVVQLLSCVQLLLPHGLYPHQAPLSMGFPRQEYWNELPFPFPGELPDPGTEPVSLALQVVCCIAGRFFTN